MVRGPQCIRAIIVAGGVAVGLVGGCGNEPTRPALLGDYVVEGGSRVVDASTAFVSQTPVEQSCNLGPDGGVCACADQPLVVDPPTMYFILDTSGSMLEDSKWRNVQLVIRDIVTSIGPRAKFGAATFPDERSGQCAAGGEVFAPRQGDSPAGTLGPTATSLLEVLGAIPASGGTPTAATLAGITPHLLSLSGMTYAILATDGGPNCGDIPCQAVKCQANIESDVVGNAACTPMGPDCCVGDNQGCLDDTATLDAVTALAQGGVPVFVIGAPGSEPYADLLDQLATAGGTALAGEPKYYAVSTADPAAFTAALSSVAAKITGSCTLQLDQMPPDPMLVNVFLDEQVLPQSGSDGWTLDGSTVTILGASCAEIMNGSILDVRVVAGCPTQQH